MKLAFIFEKDENNHLESTFCYARVFVCNSDEIKNNRNIGINILF
jgi:hypothetical protein